MDKDNYHLKYFFLKAFCVKQACGHNNTISRCDKIWFPFLYDIESVAFMNIAQAM